MTEYFNQWMAMITVPRKMLLIDDSKEDCDLVVRNSRDFNICWDVVHNPEDALRLLRKNRNQCSKDCRVYHLVVLDLQLQQKLDGVDLFKEIKKFCPNIPVLILSGYLNDDVIKRVTSHGFAMFAQKPSVFDTGFFSQLFLALNIPRKIKQPEEIIQI